MFECLKACMNALVDLNSEQSFSFGNVSSLTALVTVKSHSVFWWVEKQGKGLC